MEANHDQTLHIIQKTDDNSYDMAVHAMRGASGMNYRMSTKEIVKVLDCLIGDTEPTGESESDERTLYALKTLIDITNWCLDGVERSAHFRHDLASSVRENGETAFSAMCEWEEWLKTNTEEM